MSNRQLTDEERALAIPLLDEVRERLKRLSKGDANLEWAMRRYLYIRLEQDERGKPMERRLLKAKLKVRQTGLCALCHQPLPEKGDVLDRLAAMSGYTEDNTRLLCPSCDKAVQEGRRYS